MGQEALVKHASNALVREKKQTEGEAWGTSTVGGRQPAAAVGIGEEQLVMVGISHGLRSKTAGWQGGCTLCGTAHGSAGQHCSLLSTPWRPGSGPIGHAGEVHWVRATCRLQNWLLPLLQATAGLRGERPLPASWHACRLLAAPPGALAAVVMWAAAAERAAAAAPAAPAAPAAAAPAAAAAAAAAALAAAACRADGRPPAAARQPWRTPQTGATPGAAAGAAPGAAPGTAAAAAWSVAAGAAAAAVRAWRCGAPPGPPATA